MFVSYYLLKNGNSLCFNGMLGFKMRLTIEMFLRKCYFICFVVKICKQATTSNINL